MKHLVIVLFCLASAWADRPQAFAMLSAQLESEIGQLKALAALPQFDRNDVDEYADAQRQCFDKGYALDAAIAAHDTQRKRLGSDYLSCLRTLQKKSKDWQHRYEVALEDAIEEQAEKDFEMMVTHPLASLKRPSLQDKAVAYYDTIRSEHNISTMETIREDALNALYVEDEEDTVKDQPVFGVSEARKRKLPVSITAKERYNSYIFFAKNRNNFPVTLTLSLRKMKNFKANEKLPCTIELGPKSEKKVLDVDVVDQGKGSSMLPHYSWIMGRVSAVHSDPLYRLPFALGSKAHVSQGFNGGVTHMGRSCYAVDFSCPIGTKIYAARGGKVIAVNTSHNQGGFDKSFRKDANYIIIEHDDDTLGKYVHLKQYGSVVKTGDTVRTGQLIGYSGNTGYTSGPHLHFCVSSVDPDSKRLSVTLPFRFETAKGAVDAPKSRDVYEVVKVR